jgi:HemY protein
MGGDRAGAERAFRAMLRKDETKLLGLRGLYIEAQRANDHAAARKVAEEAAGFAPALGWAGQAVLEDRCASGDWSGALESLERMRKGLGKPEYRRKRAVLLTAQALALADIDRDASRAAVLEAVKLAPDLVPAAALAGRRLSESDEPRKARRILERAWEASPHPDIADAYAHVRLGDSARERLARVQKLADKVPGQLEGALAVARAALEAREFGTARTALAPFLSTPTQRVAALMAEIEEAPAPAEAVAPESEASAEAAPVPAEAPVMDSASVQEPPPAEAPGEKSAPVEPIIPLLHAPDDPGPEGPVPDPEREAIAPADTQRWQIKDLFK